MHTASRFLLICLCAVLTGCEQVLNDPYPHNEQTGSVYYTSFAERPRFLDPARVYSADEIAVIAQIYEPPLQYHYLKRPYELVPLSAARMPKVTYLDKNKNPLANDIDPQFIAYTAYDIEILPGMRYQPHPAFAKDEHNVYRYHDLTTVDLKNIKTISDFEYMDTRTVVAADYVYEIKRLANPTINSPIYGFMKEYIVGLEELNNHWDSQKTLEGAQVIDEMHYRILIRGKYLPFSYWLAMPFFAPMPWEADVFYANPLLVEKNIVLDWFPIGSGPYYLAENNPNHRMVLRKNPYFHGEKYPSEGTQEQHEQGLLADAGKPLPFIDTAVFTLEKESIPRWNKFLQGYYDASGLTSDNFNQAVQSGGNQAILTPTLQKMGIELLSEIEVADFYWGFNMLDPVVGGTSDSAKKLRQAISIAVDMEEYISIFLNDKAVAAQNIIPPGIYGYETLPEGVNPYVYTYKNSELKRRPIEDAKKLMKEAGYQHGIDPKTGRALVIHLDASSQGDPADKARFAWMRKQFSKLGINLNVRLTDYNRFRQKLEEGYAQFFGLGWFADYPDPENFFMLLYAPNSKMKNSGVNSTNYQNNQYDLLFSKMRKMENSPERMQLIKKMIAILQEDAPMIWGYYPESFLLKQPWYKNVALNGMANNTLKYHKIDTLERSIIQEKENKPVFWPALLLLLFIMIIFVPVLIEYIKRERTQCARRTKNS